MARSAREKILEAALPLFLEQGLAGTRTEEICARAGVSNGSLFHAFASKEAIAVALYVDAIASYQAALTAELDKDRGAEAAIRALVRAHWSWIAENERTARFLFGMGRPDWHPESGQQTQEMNERMGGAFADWWRAKAKSGEALDLPVAAASAILFGPSLTAMRAWLGGRPSKPVRGLAGHLADAAVRALVKG